MKFAILMMLCGAVLSCASAVSTDLPPEAAALAPHLDATERRHLAAIAYIHGGKGIITRARQSGTLADNVEWWVAGPPDVLPFAGTWRGLDGMAEFTKRLDETMRYDKVELVRYLVSGDDVAAIFIGEGIARATGKPFHSEIVRLYEFEGDKVVRVRNYYDTASYVAAVRGQ